MVAWGKDSAIGINCRDGDNFRFRCAEFEAEVRHPGGNVQGMVGNSGMALNSQILMKKFESYLIGVGIIIQFELVK